MAAEFDFKSSIFSQKNDVLVFFIIPFTVAFLLGLTYFLNQESIYNISPWTIFIIFVFFDYLHVYLGIGIATGLKQSWLKFKKFILLFPILCFAIYSALYNIDPKYFLTLYAYASAFHFARQQIGWMRVCGRRGKVFLRYEHLLDDLAIYFSTFGFLVYKISSQENAQWFSPGDLGYVQWLPTNLILILIGLVNLFYIGWQISNLIRFKYMNMSKNLIWLTTFIFWGTAFFVFKNYNVISLALIVVLHAAPFIFLSYKYVKMRLPQALATPNRLPKIFTGIFIFALVFSLTEHLVIVGFPPFYEFSKLELLEPFLASISTLHYGIDTFFWRQSYNPGCMDFKTV